MQFISPFALKKYVCLAMILAMGSPLWCGFATGEPSSSDATTESNTKRLKSKHTHHEPQISLPQRAGYVAEQATFLGTIYHAMGEPSFLRTDDLALIDVGSDRHLKVDDRLVVYRILEKVRHPQTHETAGHPILMLGEATVTRVEDKTAMIRVTLAFDEIEIGDRVERSGALPPPVKMDNAPAKAALRQKSLQSFGSILGAKYDKIAIAEGDFVFIDQGVKHGVQKGDQFFILEDARTAHHPDTSVAMPVPRQTIGSLTVLDVQDRTSTAFVTESVREFEAGALIQHASQGSGPTAQLASLSDADALTVLIPPCLEETRQAIRAAQAEGAEADDLAEARDTLAYATATFEQAQSLLDQGKREEALQLLETVRADCLTAQQLAKQTTGFSAPVVDETYTIQPGDTLWDIAALPRIYRDPYLWPLLYQANRTSIHDPDLIYPQQVLRVPRQSTQEEKNAAAHRARTRGPWRLGDGPDVYILEGRRP